MSEGIPDDFPQPTVAPPEPSSDGLSGGEIAAILVVLIAVITALLIGIIAIIYYKRRHRFKWLIHTDTTSNEYTTDTFSREGATGDNREILPNPTMAMTSKEDTLPAQSLIVTNEEAVKRASEDAAAHTDEGDGKRADNGVVKDAEDTVL